MKKVLIVILAVFVLLFAAGAIWWHELNVIPEMAIPKSPPLPSPNAYDYFMAASQSIPDLDKVLWARMNRPPGYKSPFNEPDDRYYSPAEKDAFRREYLPIAAKVRLGLPYAYQTPDGANSGTEYSQIGAIGMMEESLARFAAAEGDWGSAMNNSLDAVQIGETVTHGGSMVSLFTGLEVEGEGHGGIWKAVDHLTRAQTLSAIARLQAAQDDAVPLDRVYEEDKYNSESMLIYLFQRPRWRNGYLDGKNLLSSYLTSDRVIMRNETVFDEEWIEKVRRPYAARLPLPKEPSDPWHEYIKDSSPPWAPLNNGGGLNYSKMEMWFQYTLTQTVSHILLTALALHAYKLDHGAYSASLSQLTPGYLKNVPSDPFALSGPLRYKRVGGKYVLYSVGPDGHDDGGQPIFQSILVNGRILSPPSHYFVDIDSKGDIVAGVNID